MQETVKNVLTGHFNKKKAFWFFLTALVTIIVWNLPSGVFGIAGLTVVQQRVIAIFVMAVMLWLTEAIPSWATSVTIIFVLLFFVSNSSFKFMQGSEGEYGQLLEDHDPAFRKEERECASWLFAHYRHLLDVHLQHCNGCHDADVPYPCLQSAPRQW